MKKGLKYAGLSILLLVLIAGAGSWIFRKQLVKHYLPEVEQTGEISIDIRNDTSYISSQLIVKNKTFLKIEIDTLKYQVSLFGTIYLQRKQVLGIVLPAYGKDTIDFSLKVPHVVILNALKTERRTGDSANYAIAVSLQVSTVFGKTEMPITKTAKIKIPQPPELKIVAIKYRKVRLKTILADAQVSITNHTSVNLSVKELHYLITISKQGTMAGSYHEPIQIKPNGSTLVSIPIRMSPKNMGRTVFDIITNKDNYDYTLTLNAVVESSDSLKKSFHLNLKQQGKMELRK